MRSWFEAVAKHNFPDTLLPQRVSRSLQATEVSEDWSIRMALRLSAEPSAAEGGG